LSFGFNFTDSSDEDILKVHIGSKNLHLVGDLNYFHLKEYGRFDYMKKLKIGKHF